MSVNLTVEIHGLCGLLVKGTEGTRLVCLAEGHVPVLTVAAADLDLTPGPGRQADRVMVVGDVQYAQWDLAGCGYDLGDKAKGPATVSDSGQTLFRMQSGYFQSANASVDAWDGSLGKVVAARMSLYGGVLQPGSKTVNLTLAPVTNEPDYSHGVSELVTFTAPGAPETIDLGNGKIIPLAAGGNPTISICNFGTALENSRFAHLEMYHGLLQDQGLPYRKAGTGLGAPGFIFPMGCVPPTLFEV